MNTLLPQPTAVLIAQAGREFDSDPATQLAETTLGRLFARFPQNAEIQDVLPKLLVLDQLYSTRILSIHVEPLARHIVNMRIDPLLAEGELGVGDLIMNCDGLPQYFSFASKYCSWHNPTAYPIYDSYAEECLWRYRQKDGFLKYARSHYGYADFVRIVTTFREFYGLTRFTFKELDKFLFLTGGHLKGKFVFTALAEGRLGTETIVSMEPGNPDEEVPQELKDSYEAQFGRPWYPGAERFVDSSDWTICSEESDTTIRDGKA